MLIPTFQDHLSRKETQVMVGGKMVRNGLLRGSSGIRGGGNLKFVVEPVNSN